MRICGFVMAFIMTLGVAAQNYSGDVTYLSGDDQVVTVRSSGIHPKKKEAVEMALKSAFHSLFYAGVEGIYNGKPLVTKENKFFMERFMSQRYIYYIRSHQEEGVEKLPTKEYRATVTMTILLGRLIKDLTTEKMMEKPLDKISMEETQEEIALPSIMVVPYKRDGETFKSVLADDFDRRMAVGKVQDGFNQRGVTTVDLEAKLNATMRSMEFENNTEDSNDKQLLINSGAEVYVVVDLQKEILYSGSRVSLSMKAYETASGNVLASRQGWTNRFQTTALDRLCVYAVDDQLEGFLNDISKNFARKITKGNSVVLKFSIGSGSMNTMSTQVGPNHLSLSNVIRQWVRKNSQNGRYHLQGIVDESMIFDNVQIPPKDTDGFPMDTAQFAENLIMYLSEMGVTCENKLDGNTVYITIF